MLSLDELMKAERLIHNLPDVPLEYRIYYDNTGNIIECSMQNHPEGENYIVVDQTDYNNYFRYTVKDKKLVPIEIDRKYKDPIKRSEQGAVTVKNHAGLILEPGEIYRCTDTYANSNN